MNDPRVGGQSAAAGYLEEGRGADLLALCLMLFMVMNSVAMSLMPIVRDDLQSMFSFSSSQIGFLTAIFMLAFALGAIPMGLAAVRWGGRTLIAGALVLAVGSAVFAFSASYEWFLVGRVLQGIGGSTVIPVSNHLMAHTIAPQRQARALGIFGTGHGLGVVAALLIMPSVQAAGGYRAVFLVSAGIGLALAAVATAQRHIRARVEKGAGEATAAALLREVGSVAKNRRLWLLAVINIGVMAIVVGILAWTPAFLNDQRGASLAVAAYLTAGVGVAQMLGNIAGAAAMARWGKAFVLLSGMAVMLVATAMAPAGPGVCPRHRLRGRRWLPHHGSLSGHHGVRARYRAPPGASGGGKRLPQSHQSAGYALRPLGLWDASGHLRHRTSGPGLPRGLSLAGPLPLARHRSSRHLHEPRGGAPARRLRHMPATPERIPPGPGQESVWDYPRPPRLEETARHIQVIFAGTVIADSRRAKRVLETSHAPTYYLPPDDVHLEYFKASPRRTVCEWKGEAV